MSITGVEVPFLIPCDDAGGALVARSLGTDSLVPQWTNKQWTASHLVKDRQNPTDPWIIYLATQDHNGGGAAPSTGAPGWQALGSAPTQIPAWKPSTAYSIGQPVRIDTPTGMRLFVASKAITTSSTASPDTPAGKTAGWEEVEVIATPAAPLFSGTKAYRQGDLVQSPLGTVWVAKNPIAASTNAPGTAGASTDWVSLHAKVTTRYLAAGTGAAPTLIDPPNPIEGDKFINTLLGVSWIYADDPQTPGLNLQWLREGQVSYRTNKPMVTTPTKGFDTTAVTVPDPVAVPPRDNDVVFVHDPVTKALQAVEHL